MLTRLARFFDPPSTEYEDAASDSSSSSSSSDQSDEAQHYAGHDHSRDPGPVGKLKTFFESFTMRGATDRLLRKTVGKDKFIFVADLDFHSARSLASFDRPAPCLSTLTSPLTVPLGQCSSASRGPARSSTPVSLVPSSS